MRILTINDIFVPNLGFSGDIKPRLDAAVGVEPNKNGEIIETLFIFANGASLHPPHKFAKCRLSLIG